MLLHTAVHTPAVEEASFAGSRIELFLAVSRSLPSAENKRARSERGTFCTLKRPVAIY